MAGQGFAADDRPDFPKILEFFTDLGVLTPAAVSDELIRLYQ